MTIPQVPNDECFKSAGKEWEIAHNMPSECFKCAEKEPLTVGTELLVFGDVFKEQMVWRYSSLTNSWACGVQMNEPRFKFACASLGEKAIVAGGFDKFENVLNSAELYNSETRCSVTIPSMNKARSFCSGVFMDGKFYVLGGCSSNDEDLTCREEYDLEKQSWRVIPNMSARLHNVNWYPFVAVVRNELYTADYSEGVLRKYDKKSNVWVTLGPMPEKHVPAQWWNVCFCACGDRLLAIHDSRAYPGGA